MSGHEEQRSSTVVPKSYSLSVLDHLLLTPALWNAGNPNGRCCVFYFDFSQASSLPEIKSTMFISVPGPQKAFCKY